MFSLIQAAVAPQPGEEGIKLKAVIGYNGNGRGNMVWSPDQGYHNILSLKNALRSADKAIKLENAMSGRQCWCKYNT